MIQFKLAGTEGRPSQKLSSVVNSLHFLMNEEHGRWVPLAELRDLHAELAKLAILPVVETVTVEEAVTTLTNLHPAGACCLVAFVIRDEVSMPPRYAFPNSAPGDLFYECVPGDRVVVVGVTMNSASELDPIGLTGTYRMFTLA